MPRCWMQRSQWISLGQNRWSQLDTSPSAPFLAGNAWTSNTSSGGKIWKVKLQTWSWNLRASTRQTRKKTPVFYPVFTQRRVAKEKHSMESQDEKPCFLVKFFQDSQFPLTAHLSWSDSPARIEGESYRVRAGCLNDESHTGTEKPK